MAIQKINLGSEPLGEGGDTYRSANTKINENFSNTDHAASRLVGTGTGQIPLSSQVGEAYGKSLQGFEKKGDVNDALAGEIAHYNLESANLPSRMACVVYTQTQHANANVGRKYQLAVEYAGKNKFFRTQGPGGWGEWVKHYTTASTKKDSNTNLILESGDTIPNESAASRTVYNPWSGRPTSGSLVEYRTLDTAYTASIGGTGWGGDGGVLNTDPEITDPDLIAKALLSDLYHTRGSRIHALDKPSTLGANGACCIFARAKGVYFNLSVGHFSREAILAVGYNVNGDMLYTPLKLWTDRNTKLDTNGALAPSSPTIDLYRDRIETNDDGAKMNPEFIRNGVGDYTIKNTTGLRDEGWYIKIPNDMNGNPKVAVAIDTDKDGNLSIKTYKRTFSMETFTFGPDLSEPLDIPEGRWIDLRFNDLPQEELYEPELEEEPLVDEEEEPEVVEDPEEPVEESE